MKKAVLLGGIVIVVALAAVLAMRFYPQMLRPGAPAAGTAVEPEKTVAEAPAKPVELSEEAKKELEGINKIADPKIKHDQLMRFYGEHDVDQAIRLGEEAIRANPDPGNWLPSAQLVECYLQKDDLVNAEKYLKNVMQGEQKASYALRVAAKFYVKKKDFAKATETLDKAMKYSEDDENRSFTYGSFAEMYLEQGEKEKARESLQKAIKLAPRVEHFKNMMSQFEETKAQ